MNFFRPKVNTTSSGFVGSNVDVGKSSGIVRDETFVLTFQGLKVQERVCRDGVWKIERCLRRRIFIVLEFNEIR